MRHHLVWIVASLALATLILYPIFGSGNWYPMHDSTHIERVELMVQTLRGGQFPPIWASDINAGLGYPLFHFYAPLFHLFAALLTLLIGSALTAVKLTLWLSCLVGIYGATRLGGTWGRVGGLIGGFAFALSPYLALSLYVRGSYSELLSLAILPWVIIATRQIQSRKQVFWAALALALFVLSHNLIPLLAFPLILVWTLAHNYQRPLYLVFTLILTFGLSAWFVLPLLFERDFTQADQVAQVTDYSLHYVQPWQLWDSTWGFGGSAPGVEDGMSFKLGKLQLLLGLLGLILAVLARHRSLLILGFFLLFSFWLATPWSGVLWDRVWILHLVQFPWRALGIIALLLSVFSAYFVTRVTIKPLRNLLALSLLLLLPVYSLKYFKPQSLAPYTKPTQDLSEIVPEFMPVWLSSERMGVLDSTVLPYAYYPTWEVKLDGKEVDAFPSKEGLLAFVNQDQSDNYQFRQAHTPLMRWSYALTSLTLISLVFYFIINKYVKS